jgi:hypothetical protein
MVTSVELATLFPNIYSYNRIYSLSVQIQSHLFSFCPARELNRWSQQYLSEREESFVGQNTLNVQTHRIFLQIIR